MAHPWSILEDGTSQSNLDRYVGVTLPTASATIAKTKCQKSPQPAMAASVETGHTDLSLTLNRGASLRRLAAVRAVSPQVLRCADPDGSTANAPWKGEFSQKACEKRKYSCISDYSGAGSILRAKA